MKIGYFFPIIKILPAKPKKEKQSKKKKKTSDKKEKKSPNPVIEFTKKHGLDGLIELLKELVGIVLKLTDTISSSMARMLAQSYS